MDAQDDIRELARLALRRWGVLPPGGRWLLSIELNADGNPEGPPRLDLLPGRPAPEAGPPGYGLKAPPADAVPQECQCRVLAALGKAGSRRTAGELADIVVGLGHPYSQRQVERALASLRAAGRIDNRPDAGGYGFPEWN